jgi:glycosyltransferase involved in cell wall biosynthesis
LSTWALWLFNLRGGFKYNSAFVPYPVKCNSFLKPNFNNIILFREKNNIPKNAFVIGRIGQAYDGKWSPLLVDTFNVLCNEIPDLFLLIINPPKSVLDQAKQSPFAERIIHISKIIGDENLALAYASMDLMLHIALQGESFGLVLTESILCETPVVTLSTPWADNSQGEVVGHKKGGLVVHSKKGLKNAILEIYNNPKAFAVSGLKHIKENYDYINVAKKAIELSNKENEISFLPNSVKIIHLLNNSLDRPNILTEFFLRMQSNRLRKLTIYTTSYKNIYKSLWKKIW